MRQYAPVYLVKLRRRQGLQGFFHRENDCENIKAFNILMEEFELMNLPST